MYWSEVGMIKKASLNGSEVSTLLSRKVSVVGMFCLYIIFNKHEFGGLVRMLVI